MKKPSKKDRVLSIYDCGKKGISLQIRQENMEDLPLYATALLEATIRYYLESDNDPIDVMKACKTIVQSAWEENGLSFEPVEHIDDDENRRDRMGL